jgi:uncharacterized protein YecE (DUF72 family)
MSWFWMNIPLALVFFAAWCGIPLYMVLRHRNWTTHPADYVALEITEPAAGEVVVVVAEPTPREDAA